MMTRNRAAAFALPLLLALCVGAAAQAAPVKLGFVDLQRAIEETEEGKKAKASLRAVFEAKQKELSAKQEALKKAKGEYDTKRLMMTPEARGKAEQELQQQFMELQSALVSHQKELAGKEAEVMKKILAKMERILQQIGTSQNFTMILEKGEGRVLFGQPALDLTNEVIRRYNEMK